MLKETLERIAKLVIAISCAAGVALLAGSYVRAEIASISHQITQSVAQR
jgi:hypothetical protein